MIVAVYGRTEIAAIITSFAAVPEGSDTASDWVFVAAEDALLNAMPGAEAELAARNSGLNPFAALEAALNAGGAANTIDTAPNSTTPSAGRPHEVQTDFRANVILFTSSA